MNKWSHIHRMLLHKLVVALMIFMRFSNLEYVVIFLSTRTHIHILNGGIIDRWHYSADNELMIQSTHARRNMDLDDDIEPPLMTVCTCHRSMQASKYI